jgi:hypothetical protein
MNQLRIDSNFERADDNNGRHVSGRLFIGSYISISKNQRRTIKKTLLYNGNADQMIILKSIF